MPDGESIHVRGTQSQVFPGFYGGELRFGGFYRLPLKGADVRHAFEDVLKQTSNRVPHLPRQTQLPRPRSSPSMHRLRVGAAEDDGGGALSTPRVRRLGAFNLTRVVVVALLRQLPGSWSVPLTTRIRLTLRLKLTVRLKKKLLKELLKKYVLFFLLVVNGVKNRRHVKARKCGVNRLWAAPLPSPCGCGAAPLRA